VNAAWLSTVARALLVATAVWAATGCADEPADAVAGGSPPSSPARASSAPADEPVPMGFPDVELPDGVWTPPDVDPTQLVYGGDGPWFEVAGPESGITHRNLSGPTAEEGKVYLRDCVGQGVAVIDVDADGWMDLFFPQGRDESDGGGDCANRLYRNEGDRTFTECAEAWGLAGREYSYGALALDYDADGDDDLLVTNFGPDVLYRNDGETFTDVTADHPGLAGGETEWSVGASVGDVDFDGDLDLYVANYVLQEIPMPGKKFCHHRACKVPCGPRGLPSLADHFYLNSGAPDWRYEEATEAAGLADVEPSYGFQPTFVDVDDDGDLDLYVTNDSMLNFLFVNDGAGRFEESGLVSGVACGRGGQAEAGMGLAVGHVDGDRLPEMYVTNFSNQTNAFYHNLTEPGGFPWFDEVSQQTGSGRPTWFLLGWGCAFADFDCDGAIDVFSANGHVYPQMDDCTPDQVVYREPNSLFRGTAGQVSMEEWSGKAGPAFAVPGPHRGSAAVDLDNDGDLDIVVTRLDEVPLLAWNETPAARRGHWLMVDLQLAGPADGTLVRAVAARAVAVAGERRWTRDLLVGSSFLSCEDPRLHFGLGDVERLDRLEVSVPGRDVVAIEDLAVDRHVVLRITADGLVEVPERDP